MRHRPVWVLLSDSNGFAAAVPYAAGQLLAHLASGDLDSDGDIDIVTSSAVTDTLAILLNNGDGTFTSGWQGDLGYHAHGLTIASLKAGDSVSIIGVGSAFNGGYYVTAVAHQMSGGTYQLADSTDLYWCGGWPVAIGSARLDADNDEDLVILQKQAGRLTILSGTSDVPVAVGDDDGPLVPLSYTLGQNYPNPFNPTTRIRFTLPHATSVQLQVFNILGQRVTSLVDDVLPAGEHVVTWDGTNRAGKRVASGIYFYRLVTGDFVQTKKMLLLK
ncbi:MAG: T9SS C-terminal target domain-containing protein [Candidatus Zixiibacteriota bacterium]|nr:MAG: T9SS C-terminal target domain-containing protein [candidate division Zixibacteria bacterium]